jgi:hypothetical protein
MPNLSLSQLQEFDPKNRNNRFCCPLCGSDKSTESKHRSIWVDKNTGGWLCHRCQSKGLLVEWQKQPSSFCSNGKYPSTTANKQSFNRSNTSNFCNFSNFSNFSYQPKEVKPVDEKKLKQVNDESGLFKSL